MKPKVLITLRIPEAHIRSELLASAEVIRPEHPGKAMGFDEALAAVSDAFAVVNHGELTVGETLLDRAPRLRIVSNVAIGTDNLDLEAMARRGVWATNAPDAFTDATADATFGLLLALARKICSGDRYVRSGRWEADGIQPMAWEGTRLAGKALGIVGFGAIGAAVARRAEAFGMDVLFTRSRPDPDPRFRTLEALLAEADIVSLHTPLTPETRRLIDAARLRLMKPGSILVNMARGKVVDEQALVDALKGGRLAGACLDVFENEPAVHPDLRDLPNVVLAPHIGGSTVESRRDARLLACDNILRVLAGQAPITPVNNVPP